MTIFELASDYLTDLGITQSWIGVSTYCLLFLGLAVVSLLADRITKRIVLRCFRAIAGKTKTELDDTILRRKVPDYLAHLAPAITLLLGSELLFPEGSLTRTITERLAQSLIILFSALAIGAGFNVLTDYSRYVDALRDKPIQSYGQVVKLIVYLISIVLIIGTVIDQSPLVLLSGLGAMTAIVLLVFKDSILGLVASIQISAYDMVRVGDWVEFPKYGADGDVIDISLNIIKIQNWDKTITSVPTHAFISDSFKNWRGMSLAGGRRIKRSLSVDMHSVKFLDEELFAKLEKIDLLKDYLKDKKAEIQAANSEAQIDSSEAANGRNLTNLGTFRYYTEAYITQHPDIRKDMTLLVRYLAPTESGIPIQIYAFSGDTRWKNYEGIVADFLDHLLAVIPEFDLKVFQVPSGSDFRDLFSQRSS